MRVLVPFGTRPEMVKLSPVLSALRSRQIGVHAVATGQHYDPGLSDVFFADLGIAPDERWQLPETEPERVGMILSWAFRSLSEQRPDLVMVLGDTYTVPLFCLAARRHQVPVVHLEAGMRSFNATSMEEVNRKVAAATASLHLTPTPLAGHQLVREGVEETRIRVVGNTVLDVLRQRGVKAMSVGEREGVVLTAHRPTNVDDPERLDALVTLILGLAEEVGHVSFPVHPRTLARLGSTGMLRRLDHDRVKLLPPLPYEDMLALMAAARVIVTDSGGLQEEASWLGIPVVVLRTTTPRWEGVNAGTSCLVGLDPARALSAAARFSQPDEQARVAATPCPYGDGHSAERVADIFADPGILGLLTLSEPALGAVGPFG